MPASETRNGLKLFSDAAMDILKMPSADREKYRSRLQSKQFKIGLDKVKGGMV